MDTSGSEDDDFIIKRAPVIPTISLPVSDHNEDSGPVTPPMDHSLKLNKSLGMVMSPHSPPYRRVRSMNLIETPRSLLKNRLDAPAFSSTPAASPCVTKIPRSLKVQRSKGKCDVKDKLNLTCGSIPTALVNPYSPLSRTASESRLSKKSRIDKKKIEFESDDESESHDEYSQNLKRPKLSDFDYPRFEREYKVVGVLGSGVHGCVYKCFHLLTGVEYAVKRSLGPVYNEKMARKEIYAHAALEHPNIVRNYISWTEDEYLFMQNEYCNGGSLEEQIREKGPMQEKELMILLENLAQGLRYIHECDLAHMDIKPGNIFLKKGLKLFYKSHDPHSDFNEDDSHDEITYKIGDLGHVIHLNSTDDVEEGDCRYFPRDILNGANLDYSKVDIFSLGLTLYEAAGGGPLPKNGDEWHKIRDGHLKNFSHLSAQFNNLLKKMIDPDPKKRPSACDLLQEIFRDEVMRDHELKAANHKIHLLEHQISDFVKTVSKSVSANAIRSAHGKKITTNNNNNIVTTSTPGRFTRSTSRLVGLKNNKSMSSY